MFVSDFHRSIIDGQATPGHALESSASFMLNAATPEHFGVGFALLALIDHGAAHTFDVCKA